MKDRGRVPKRGEPLGAGAQIQPPRGAHIRSTHRPKSWSSRRSWAIACPVTGALRDGFRDLGERLLIYTLFAAGTLANALIIVELVRTF